MELLQLVSSENIFALIVIGGALWFGKFITRDLFPWLRGWADTSTEAYFEAKEKQIKAQSKRDERYIEVWEDNTKRLAEVEKQMVEINLNMQTILESHKMFTEAFFKLITTEEVPTQDRLANLLMNEPKTRQRGTAPLKARD